MKMFACKKCGWSGDIEEVKVIQAHEFLNVDESEIDELDNEFLETCPKCDDHTLVNTIEF